jgi:putative hydrolase of the HAD superfamily
VIEAVTFDFWNTLVVDEPRGMRPLQIAGWTEVLERAGIEVHADALVEAFDAAWETFDDSWTSNRQFQTTDAVAFILHRVGTDAPASVRAELVEVYSKVGATSPLDVTPNAEATLRTLRERGVRLGVICDVGMTASSALLGRLEGFGLAELFDHFSWSDVVGVYKPDGRMFRDAFQGLGLSDPATLAHIGDRRRTDVAGARAFGSVSVRYTGVWDDPPESGAEADHVIADHAELPGVLGL